MASVKPTQQFSRWLSDATPSEDKAHSCSPVCCNLSCSAHGDLATEYEGASTGWEIASRAFAKFRASSALGTRKLLKREMVPEKGGKAFEKLTFASAYEWTSYAQVEETVAKLAAGLVALTGLASGARVLIFAETQADWLVTALACWRQGATVVTAYATLGEEGVSTSSTETGAAVCVCDGKLFKTLAKAAPNCKGLKFVVPIAPPAGCNDTTGDQLDAAAMKAKLPAGVEVLPFLDVIAAGAKAGCDPSPPAPTDYAVIMYTSGTTGGSKGVLLTHRNFCGICVNFDAALSWIRADDVYLSYLPLAHIMELGAEVYLFGKGVMLGYGSPHTLTDSGVKLKNPPPPAKPTQKGDAFVLRPTLMLFAPAVLDKVYAGVQRKFNSKLKKCILSKGLAVGYKNYDRGGHGCGGYNVVMKKVQKLLGGRVRFMGTGSAPLSPPIQKFVQSVFNCPVRQGYGCTETGGVSTIGSKEDNTTKQVGPPTKCTYIRLRDWPEGNYMNADLDNPAIGMRRGEVLLGGTGICAGYHVDSANPDPELVKKNAEDFVEIAGVRYFCTGDVGQITPQGQLQIVDRKKDLFKGATGEYVALSKVEAALKLCPYVEMPMAYGATGKASIIAIIMPMKPNVLDFAKAKGLGGDFAALCTHPDVIAEVGIQCKAFCKQGGLLGFETPTAYALVCDAEGGPAWTPDNDMLTSTMKLKRPIIARAHAAEIDDAYARS